MTKKFLLVVATCCILSTPALADKQFGKRYSVRYPEIPRISAELAYLKYKTGRVVMVDAMNPKTYAAYHILGAINVSTDGPENLKRLRNLRLPYPRNTEFIFYCD